MKIFRFLFSAFSCFCLTITAFYAISCFYPKYQMEKSHEMIIYDQNEEILLQTHYQVEGSYLSLDQIHPDLIAAFIASEDQNFFTHSGFSLKGIIRALYSNTFKGTKIGGSTITQQLARSLFLDNEKSLIRKIKEAMITFNLEAHYSKEEIIEQYLNNIYLGHNLYGVESASQYYFNKSNLQLTLDEAAMLAGIANAPNLNAPDIQYENAIARRNYVLQSLFENHYINEEERDEYLKKETKITICEQKIDHIANPFYYYALKILKENHLDQQKILAKGIKVYTHIDRDIQQKIVEAATRFDPKDQSQIAICIMKPFSNQVVAMLGSYSLQDEYNRVLMSYRPIGSTVKPLIYYLALRCHLTPLNAFVSEKTSFEIAGYGTYAPENATHTYANKKINMIEAIGLSDNIYATKMLLYIGLQNLSQLFSLFGLDIECVPSSALGVDLLSLLELTSIYNTFASVGQYYKPEIISKITDYAGNILYKSSASSRRVLEKKETLILNQLLTAPFDENLIDYTTPTLLHYQTNVPFAAKTGTTESDAYTIGFNPAYTIGVWVGQDDNQELQYKYLSKKVFQYLANQIAQKPYWYSLPTYLTARTINPLTGEETENGSIYWFSN